MRLFLIQCCKSKRGTTETFDRHRSLLEDLPPGAADELRRLRAEVRAALPNRFGGRHLSALSMYTGHLYTPRTKALATKPPPDTRFLIMSGGYGLLRPDELIEEYDINIAETAGIWRRGFGAVLNAYVAANTIDEVHALVSRSGAYREVLEAGRSRCRAPITMHMVRYSGGGAAQAVPRLQALMLPRLVAGELVDDVGGHPVERL